MILRALLLAASLLLVTTAIAAEREVTLTSLEWPPYTSESISAQGASSEVVRAAFAAMGYRLTIRFVPWSRAVEEAKHRKGIAGYFPEYYSPDVAANFNLLPPIGHGPLALAQRRDHPVQWNRIEDLSKWVVGTVPDYVNTPAFDQRVAQHLQAVDLAPDDSHNLLKLSAGRVDLAIVDPYVFNWLSENDPLVRPVAAKLEINPHPLELKDLYVCFRRDAEGQRLNAIFSEGLRRIDVQTVMRRFIPDYR